jgi:hypothetical protein
MLACKPPFLSMLLHSSAALTAMFKPKSRNYFSGFTVTATLTYSTVGQSLTSWLFDTIRPFVLLYNIRPLSPLFIFFIHRFIFRSPKSFSHLSTISISGFPFIFFFLGRPCHIYQVSYMFCCKYESNIDLSYLKVDVRPCSLAEVYRRFGGTHCLHLYSRKNEPKEEATRCLLLPWLVYLRLVGFRQYVPPKHQLHPRRQ